MPTTSINFSRYNPSDIYCAVAVIVRFLGSSFTSLDSTAMAPVSASSDDPVAGPGNNEKHTEGMTNLDASNSSYTSSNEDIDGDYGSYGVHVFTDPKVAEYWRNVYEAASYEGRHRFDPTFTWSATEEKHLKRKVSSLVALGLNLSANKA